MPAQRLKDRLQPGRAYRRSDLLPYSRSVDRELRRLVSEGVLRKEQTGLYSCPKKGKFGAVPVNHSELVERYLKTKDFVVVDHNALNGLGLGLSQLYNELTVYNQKRHGTVVLAGVKLHFKRRPGYPHRLSPEFLLVEYLNERKHLAEAPADLAKRLPKVVAKLDRRNLKRVAENFGKVSVKREVSDLLAAV